MSGQALYRKWRSQTFDEIIAQDHVTRTLQNALRSERIAHAYLFTGPRGTGKTSTARILAKAVNCLAPPEYRPCDRCVRCQAISAGRDLDLIEIDAASNRGIDEIRELRDKVAFAPNEGRYKVYVIDEVHMLTTEAFNALLKTLEEPPAHVIFVLATTEPQRIPSTILSRCQRFDFRRIPLADLCRKIERICEAEQIKIEPAAVEAIARRAGGSFRDAESLLDQLAACGESEVTLELVQGLLGSVSTLLVADLVDAWISGDLGEGLRLINRLVDEGAEARQLHLELVEYLRAMLLLQAGGDDKMANIGPEVAARMRGQLAKVSLNRLVEGLRLFSRSEALARGEVRPQLPLELAFVEAVLQGKGADSVRTAVASTVTGHQEERATTMPVPPSPMRVAPVSQVSAREPQAVAESVPVLEKTAGSSSATRAETVSAEASPGSDAPGGITLSTLLQRWPEVLQGVGAHDKRLQAFLRDGRPVEVHGTRVLLEMRYDIHRSQVAEDKNRRLLEEVLQRLFGASCQVECTVAGQSKRGSQSNKKNAMLDDPAVHEDHIIRYAVRDLGAQVSKIQTEDEI